LKMKTLFKLGVVAVVLVLSFVSAVLAQETTGGLQGTVRDPSGALVPKAEVVLKGTSLVGSKNLETDSTGYYRFANLPPGIYTIVVKAAGFSELKREGVVIEVGHLPTVELTLALGASGTVVEVSGAAPVIDVTTNANNTNITNDVIADIPHGYSFQSVIQFAPMARQEPLAGGSAGLTGNSGGSAPGSAANGGAVGFSVGGAADSENTYLVEYLRRCFQCQRPLPVHSGSAGEEFGYRGGTRRRPRRRGQRHHEERRQRLPRLAVHHL
jgi:hypothetical protein